MSTSKVNQTRIKRDRLSVKQRYSCENYRCKSHSNYWRLKAAFFAYSHSPSAICVTHDKPMFWQIASSHCHHRNFLLLYIFWFLKTPIETQYWARALKGTKVNCKKIILIHFCCLCKLFHEIILVTADRLCHNSLAFFSPFICHFFQFFLCKKYF